VKLISTLILAVSFTSLYSADSELTRRAERSVSEYSERVERARQEYLEVVEQAKEKLREDFEREIKVVMRRGDLDAANAIQAKLDELTSETGETVDEPTDFLGNPKTRVEAVNLNDLPEYSRFANKMDVSWSLNSSTVYSSSYARGNGVDGNLNTAFAIEGREGKITIQPSKPQGVTVRGLVIYNRRGQADYWGNTSIIINGKEVTSIERLDGGEVLLIQFSDHTKIKSVEFEFGEESTERGNIGIREFWSY